MKRDAFHACVYDLSQQGYKILLDVLTSSPRKLKRVELHCTLDKIAAAEWTTLLDHADSIGLFTRPESQRPAPDARIFHVTITLGGRSRELAVNDPFDVPELAMLVRLTRRAMRDRLVLTPDMLNEQQLEAIRTAVVPHRGGDDEAADEGT